MDCVEVDTGTREASSGEDIPEVGSCPGPEVDTVGVGSGNRNPIRYEGYLLVVEVGDRPGVSCFTGDKGVSDPVRWNYAGKSPYVDEILRWIGVMADGFDVDHPPSPQTRVDGVGHSGGRT